MYMDANILEERLRLSSRRKNKKERDLTILYVVRQLQKSDNKASKSYGIRMRVQQCKPNVVRSISSTVIIFFWNIRFVGERQ